MLDNSLKEREREREPKPVMKALPLTNQSKLAQIK